MSSAPRRTPASQPHALVAHVAPGDVVATRRGEPITAGRFVSDVLRAADALPASRHILNFCSDRYRFAVTLAAALARGQVTLLPPTTTPNVIRAMRDFAPDAYFVSDDPGTQVDLPRFELPAGGGTLLPFDVPSIAAEQVVACVFTSGSTGEPQPHFKRWGPLVADIRAEAKRLAVGPGHTILGTVPPQHMYGFESTVLLPLLGGAILTAERLYYPGDIDAAIGRAGAPRTLFTTPFHLRAWMESGDPAPIEMLVSATAPLSVGLARQAEERTGAILYEIYGCTEAGQVATRAPPRPRSGPRSTAFACGTTAPTPWSRAATSPSPRASWTSSRSRATARTFSCTVAPRTWSTSRASATRSGTSTTSSTRFPACSTGRSSFRTSASPTA